jgi:nucleolar protein 56
MTSSAKQTMHYLAVCVAGLFVFNEENKLIKFKLFEKTPEEIAKKIDLLEKGGEVQELKELENEFEDLEIKQPNQATEFLRKNLREIVISSGFVKNDLELNQILSSFSIAKAKLSISLIERRDKLIVQTVSALSDLEKILNAMSERLREWYGLHYPELEIKDHERFAQQLAEKGLRESFEDFEKSMGMQLKEDDIKVLQEYASQLKSMYVLRKNIEKYLEKIVPEEIPNLNTLLGSVLAARLLALAGSLERLAKMPSSTIQLLGSEKRLFKFLKSKEKDKRPPRFGLLYLHPDISTNKRELQGKIARLLSSKLTLAARADFYTKKNMSKELLEDYKKKLEEILKA